MPRTHLNIGSNLGDRMAIIELTVERLRQLALAFNGGADPDFRVSAPIESEPWGYESANRFINVGVSFDTQLPPLRLLDETQRIERDLGSATHRHPDGTYADRLIDIDIIAYGDLRVDTERLTLPHPRAALRDFVTRPMSEIDPEMLFGLKHCQNG